MARGDLIRQYFADDPKALEMVDRVERTIDAEIASMPAIDADTMAAVEQLNNDHAVLDGLLESGEISPDAYEALFMALHKRTPRHVYIASLKLIDTMNDALAISPTETPNA